jgi:Trk K+ transport system NAD-binding subunit
MSHTLRRRWKASWRDTMLLVREFRLPLAIFCLAILGGGAAYFTLSQNTNQPVSSLVEGIYTVLLLAFLQPNGEFPRVLSLQVFYFLMPLIGLSAVARGLTDFGVLFFNRQARSRQWEVAVVSTYSNHFVLVGLGHLGYGVVRYLHALDLEVVAIELDPEAELLESVKSMGVSCLVGDGQRQETLQEAGIERARAIILCTQNDTANLKMALKARGVNPGLRVVSRIFDQDFAQSLQQQFGFVAMSATGMASPAFAAAAAGVDVTRPITVEGESLSLAHFTVAPQAALEGISVGDVEQNYDVSVVRWRRDDQADFHPPFDLRFQASDVVFILGNPERINEIVHANRAGAK